jgi:hypothetical protein
MEWGSTARRPPAILTIEDCIALSELTEEEILAIAAHEGIPEMAAGLSWATICCERPGENGAWPP